MISSVLSCKAGNAKNVDTHCRNVKATNYQTWQLAKLCIPMNIPTYAYHCIPTCCILAGIPISSLPAPAVVWSADAQQANSLCYWPAQSFAQPWLLEKQYIDLQLRESASAKLHKALKSLPKAHATRITPAPSV